MTATTTATISRSDGKTYTFNLINGLWSSSAYNKDLLTQLKDSTGATTGWRYTVAADDSVELYDATGKLLSITDRNGQIQTLAYDTNNHLISVTNSFGHQLTFTYDTSNRIATMTDPAGGLYHYTYDANNNLSTATYPDNKTKTYLYENTSFRNALTGIIDENGVRYATWNYDTQGHAISSEHASGGIDKYQLAYTTDSSGNPVSTNVTDPLGTSRTYNFLTVLGVVKNAGQSQPGGSGCSAAASAMTYDANGNVASRTDFNGVKTTYTYDLSRNLETSRTEAAGTAQARTISTVWNTSFRLPDSITEPGRITRYTYDSHGNVTLSSVQDTATGTTRTWTTTYTYSSTVPGAVLSKVVNGSRTDVADLTSSAYYDPAASCSGTAPLGCRGQIRTVTNALNQVTTFTAYNANSQPLSVTDPNGLVTTFTYDPRLRLTSLTRGSLTTQYHYDAVGNLTQISFPSGLTLNYSYDAAHRLTDLTDGLGNHVHYTLDAMGNRTREDVYDATATLAATHSRSFDALNRLYRDIGALNQTTTYSYDANGNVTQISDPLNHATSYQYDALNRLIQTTDANLGKTATSYNPLDQLTGVTDPRALATSYTKNAFGDTTRTVSPDTGTTGYSYDSAGNLLSTTDARGAVTSYTYDALNRVTRKSYGTTTVTYTWDQGSNGIGHLTSMTDAAGSTTWSYDSLGRLVQLIQTTQGLPTGVGYTYDSYGRLTKLGYPSGMAVSYGYNSQGQISSLSVNGTPAITNIQYQPFGEARSWTWSNGTLYKRSYNTDANVASFALGSSNTRSLTYDAASRITATADSAPVKNQSFAYDTLDRLTSWVAPNLNQSYTYDADGNRTSSVIGSSAASYSYPATSNRLASISGANANTLTWDAAGNLLSQTGESFTYDNSGRMSTSTAGRIATTYYVNGLGQRIAKKTGAVSTILVFDQNNHLLGQFNQGGAVQGETVWLGDTPVLQVVPNLVYNIYADQSHTPRLITNSTNTPVWSWDADPFGNFAANNNPSGLGVFNFNLRFPGQFYDAETNLHYNYFRDYDPATGRFVQSDPIGLGGGVNTYTYVNGNPISLIDPDGLMGAAPGRGPYPLGQGSGIVPGAASVGAVRDFLRNYQDMRDANTIGADKYFHCKANCEAAGRGKEGQSVACTISDTREWVDQNIKGDPASASAADQVANHYGRSQGSSSSQSCSQACAPFRPNGLGMNY